MKQGDVVILSYTALVKHCQGKLWQYETRDVVILSYTALVKHCQGKLWQYETRRRSDTLLYCPSEALSGEAVAI